VGLHRGNAKEEVCENQHTRQEVECVFGETHVLGRVVLFFRNFHTNQSPHSYCFVENTLREARTKEGKKGREGAASTRICNGCQEEGIGGMYHIKHPLFVRGVGGE
jgi:hypothetical protein